MKLRLTSLLVAVLMLLAAVPMVVLPAGAAGTSATAIYLSFAGNAPADGNSVPYESASLTVDNIDNGGVSIEWINKLDISEWGVADTYSEDFADYTSISSEDTFEAGKSYALKVGVYHIQYSELISENTIVTIQFADDFAVEGHLEVQNTRYSIVYFFFEIEETECFEVESEHLRLDVGIRNGEPVRMPVVVAVNEDTELKDIVTIDSAHSGWYWGDAYSEDPADYPNAYTLETFDAELNYLLTARLQLAATDGSVRFASEGIEVYLTDDDDTGYFEYLEFETDSAGKQVDFWTICGLIKSIHVSLPDHFVPAVDGHVYIEQEYGDGVTKMVTAVNGDSSLVKSIWAIDFAQWQFGRENGQNGLDFGYGKPTFMGGYVYEANVEVVLNNALDRLADDCVLVVTMPSGEMTLPRNPANEWFSAFNYVFPRLEGEADAPIEDVAITLSGFESGKPVGDLSVGIQGEHFSLIEGSVKLYDYDDNLITDGKIQYDTIYTLHLQLRPDDGYTFVNSVGEFNILLNDNLAVYPYIEYDSEGKEYLDVSVSLPVFLKSGTHMTSLDMTLNGVTVGGVVDDVTLAADQPVWERADFSLNSTTPTIQQCTPYTVSVWYTLLQGYDPSTLTRQDIKLNGIPASCIDFYIETYEGGIEIEMYATFELPGIHNAGSSWKVDGKNHWHECVCGGQADFAAHADENSDGVCDVCESSITTNPDAGPGSEDVTTPGGSNPPDDPHTPNDPTGTDAPDGENSKVWLIIGLVVGVVLLLAGGGVIILLIAGGGITAAGIAGKKKKKSRAKTQAEAADDPETGSETEADSETASDTEAEVVYGGEEVEMTTATEDAEPVEISQETLVDEDRNEDEE